MVEKNMPPKWQTGKPKGGVNYIAYVSDSTGRFYKFLHYQLTTGGNSNWVSYDGYVPEILAFIKLKDALHFLTGLDEPPKDGEKIEGKLAWHYGEPDSKTPDIITAVPFEYDLVNWDDEYGWSRSLEYCYGYIPLDEFLDSVEQMMPCTI